MAPKIRKSRSVPLMLVPLLALAACDGCEDTSNKGQFVDPETGQPVADQPKVPDPGDMKYCTDSEGKVVDDELCNGSPAAPTDTGSPVASANVASSAAPTACASAPYGPPPAPATNSTVTTTTVTETSEHVVDHHGSSGLVIVPRPTYVWYYGGPVHFAPGMRVYGGGYVPRTTRVYVTPGISRGVAPPLVSRGGFGSTGVSRGGSGVGA